MSNEITPFEEIRRTNLAGNEFWSSRDFARVLGYVNYRHFQAVIEKARTACSNSRQQVDDHFVGSDQMVEIGSGAQRKLETVLIGDRGIVDRRSKNPQGAATLRFAEPMSRQRNRANHSSIQNSKSSQSERIA